MTGLVLDGSWTSKAVFWWPAFGTAFPDGGLPELGRGAGADPRARGDRLAALAWCWMAFGWSDEDQPAVVPAHGAPEPGAAAVSTAVSLIVVRHGRTEANAARRLLGHLDLPLDELGQAQADGAGRRRSGRVDRVVTQPAAAHPPDRGRVRRAGVGRRPADRARLRRVRRLVAVRRAPVDVAAVARGSRTSPRPAGSRWPHCGSGSRMRSASWPTPARSETVVVVTHVSPIKAAVTWALGVGDEVVWRLFVSPASITRIAVADGSTGADLVQRGGPPRRTSAERARPRTLAQNGVRRGGPDQGVRSEEGTVHTGCSGPPRRVGLVWTPVVPSLQHP